MRNRRAIAFFLLCSVLLAIALAALSVGTRPAADVPRIKLSGFDVRAISSLGIERRNASDASAERISIVRVDGKWRIDAPISAVADENVVKSIIAEVVFAEPNDELSDADIASLGRSFQDFGLASPRFTVVLSDGGRQEICLFGRDTPAGDEVYVRLEGRGGVFTVARKIVDRLSLPLDELRQRQLFSFKAVDVVGISLKNAGEPLSKLAKADGAWRLVEPVDAPADKTASDGLVAALCSARVKEYASSKTGADAVLRLGDDEGYVILLRDSFGTVEKVVLGAPVGTNAVWALTSEGAVAKIDASLRDICRSGQQALEDTRVFPVEAGVVTSLSFMDGFPAYSLCRTNSASPWRLVSPVDAPADAVMVDKLMSKVLALRGIELAADDGAKHMSVSVGTATTNFPVRTVADDFMPKGMRLADLRDKELIRYPRAKVKRIRVKTSAGVEWDATKSETLLTSLETGIVAEGVEAVVLQEDDFKRCGFDSPSYTFTFELDDDMSALRKILLGDAAPGGGRFATIGGSDAAFILSAAVVSALTKPVENKDSDESREK